jgi:prolipoprotein diacylglyceryl transferase
MSFHGGLLGIIIGTIIFSKKNNFDKLVLLDVVSCVAPLGIFFGRLANFINAELYGKPTDVPWAVIFPLVDNQGRHPSQIYEALLEGALLFFILNLIIKKTSYKKGICAAIFLIFYSISRIISEFFREPDIQVGYIFNYISMGSLLSFFMFGLGILMYFKIK